MVTTFRGTQRNKLGRFRADLVFGTRRSVRLSETLSPAGDRLQIVRQGLGLPPKGSA